MTPCRKSADSYFYDIMLRSTISLATHNHLPYFFFFLFLWKDCDFIRILKVFCKFLSLFFSSSNKTFRVCCWKAMAAAEIDQRDAYRLILGQNEVFFAYGPLFGRKTMHIFCQWDEISVFFLPPDSRPNLLSSIHNLVRWDSFVKKWGKKMKFATALLVYGRVLCLFTGIIFFKRIFSCISESWLIWSNPTYSKAMKK